MLKTHRDLAAWQISMDLVKAVYRLTASFPSQERYGLINQMRRCAVSVPSNIAEGAARQSHREFIQYLYTARGSLSELQTQLILSEQLGFCKPQPEMIDQTERIFAVLHGLIKTLKR